MPKLQLIKDNVVVNTIEVDCDAVIMDEAAAPGDVFEPGSKTFTRPE